MHITGCYGQRSPGIRSLYTVLLVLALGATVPLAAGDRNPMNIDGSSAQLEDVRLEYDGDLNGQLRVTLAYWQGPGAPVTNNFDVCTSTPHGLWSDVEAQVACREMGHVQGQAVPGGPLQTFARAAVDVRCSSADVRLAQCTGVYSAAPRSCYPARVICHSHLLGPKDPSQRPQHISLYIGIGVSAGIICLGCVLAWVLIRRFRRRAALETQPPTWRMPGALPGVQAAYGSEAQRRFPTDDKV